jgi:hypothetical protein
MKALRALLSVMIVALGVWIAITAYPPVPFIPASNERWEGYAIQNRDADPYWVTGTIRHIDPQTGTVLLQTEQGLVELFAPPLVRLSLTEGKTVSVYVAADELAATTEL